MPPGTRKMTWKQQQDLVKQHQQLLEYLQCSSTSESGREGSPIFDTQQDVVGLGNQGGSGSSELKPLPSLFPPFPGAKTAEQEVETAEPLGSPVQTCHFC